MGEKPTVKRWTAKRKAALVLNIFKATVVEVASQHDMAIDEVEGRVDEPGGMPQTTWHPPL